MNIYHLLQCHIPGRSVLDLTNLLKHDCFIIYVCVFCISDTFIAKENKDIRLVQQQTKHLCKCKYVNNDYASCGPQA